MPRFRFSLRTLLIAGAVLAAILALSIRFGPHIVWKTVHSDISSGVLPIPSKPLIAEPPDDDLVACHVGPVSFELPKSMSNTVDVHRGIGGVFLIFHDDDRSLTLKLPQPDDRWLQQEIIGFPDKAKLTFPRLYKEITDAQSSDFSYGMSHRELLWHKWLLANRSLISIDMDLIEYIWRPDLEGNLLFMSSEHMFQWATVDGQWQGEIYFKCPSPDDTVWSRHVCTTFAIDGDPSVFQNCDDATIKSMVRLIEVPDPGITNR